MIVRNLNEHKQKSVNARIVIGLLDRTLEAERVAIEAMDETASTTSLLRVMNERAVFERIRQFGPVSRPQLADATGLSKPTISLALADLERWKLVRPVGHRSGSTGRAAVLYEIRPEAGYVIAVDVGRAWIRLALANLAGVVLARRTEPSQASSSRKLVAQISKRARALAAEAGVDFKRITFTVIGSPGFVDPRSGTIQLAPNLAGWGHPRVLEALGQQLGPEFAVENDVKLATLGEQAKGLGQGVANFALVSIGTGIGMGIVIDGRLYRGSRGAAGEIGYLPVGEPEAKAEYGMQRRGWLESVAAADGVVASARRLGLKGKMTAKEVFEAARQGDYRAQQVVSIEAEHLARAVAALTSVIDPELVVLGGGIGGNGDLLIRPIEKRLRTLLRLPPPRIVVSSLGEDAVVLGALATALTTAREKVFARVVGA
jgi:predicted NBD/HSP70 family sugar kinase